MTRRTAITIVAGSLAFLTLVVVGLATFFGRGIFAEDDQYEIELVTIPHEATVTFNDGEAFEHSGGEANYTLEEDHVEVLIDRDGFAPATVDYELDADEPTRIIVELTPQSAEAEEVYREESGYYDSQAELTEESLEHAEELYEANEILQAMPEETETFRAYQGVSEEGNDFAVHVYLYEGNEDTGREDFEDWVAEQNVDIDDLEVIEHIDDEAPPTEIETPESWADIENAEPADVDDFSTDRAGMDADELALHFLQIANTHDASQDASAMTAFTRANDLTTVDIEEPANPFHYPQWWDALDADAVAYPWVETFNRETDGDQTNITARVCWAWIPQDGSEPFLDVPRSWELTVADDDAGDPIITSFDYQDAYHGDDPEAGPCGRSLGL